MRAFVKYFAFGRCCMCTFHLSRTYRLPSEKIEYKGLLYSLLAFARKIRAKNSDCIRNKIQNAFFISVSIVYKSFILEKNHTINTKICNFTLCYVSGAPPGRSQVWMQAPQPPPNCPPGLEYLTQIDQLLIKQEVELLEGMSRSQSFQPSRYHTRKKFKLEPYILLYSFYRI